MKHVLLLSSCLLVAAPAQAQTGGMQSPAYRECTALATSNPAQALAKAEAWLNIDSGTAARHCRAMALFGLHRFDEAASALVATRASIAPETIGLRSYVARQAAEAYLKAESADKALAVLSEQIDDIGNYRHDNATAAKLTSGLLLDRARLNITYGRLDASIKDLDHAVSLTPLDEEVLFERAGVFEKLGDLPLARNDLAAVLRLAPGHNAAKKALGRLSAASAAPAPVTATPEPAAEPEAALSKPTPPSATPTKKAPDAVTPPLGKKSPDAAPATSVMTRPALPVPPPTSAP